MRTVMTFLFLLWRGTIRNAVCLCLGKTFAHNQYQVLTSSASVFCDVPICHFSLCIVRLGATAVMQRLESWLDTEELACIISHSYVKQGSTSSLHWKQGLCPPLRVKNTWPSS